MLATSSLHFCLRMFWFLLLYWKIVFTDTEFLIDRNFFLLALGICHPSTFWTPWFQITNKPLILLRIPCTCTWQINSLFLLSGFSLCVLVFQHFDYNVEISEFFPPWINFWRFLDMQTHLFHLGNLEPYFPKLFFLPYSLFTLLLRLPLHLYSHAWEYSAGLLGPVHFPSVHFLFVPQSG